MGSVAATTAQSGILLEHAEPAEDIAIPSSTKITGYFFHMWTRKMCDPTLIHSSKFKQFSFDFRFFSLVLDLN